MARFLYYLNEVNKLICLILAIFIIYFLFYRYTPKNCVNFEIEEEQQQPKSKQLKKFWDNNKNEIILALFFIVIFLITPFLLQLNLLGFSTWLKGCVRIGTPRDWLGFWSSYLGSVLTVAFSYSIAKYETKKQQEILQKQWEHDNEFKLLETMVEYRDFLESRRKTIDELYNLTNVNLVNDDADKILSNVKNILEKSVKLINDIRQSELVSLKYYSIINSLNKDIGQNISDNFVKVVSILIHIQDNFEEIKKKIHNGKYINKPFDAYYDNIKSLIKEDNDLYLYIENWLLNK